MKKSFSSSLFSAALLLVHLLVSPACKTTSGLQVGKVQYASTPVSGKDAGEDAALETMLASYRNGMEAKMNRIIGVADDEFVKGGKYNSLGNFVADALRNQTGEKFKTTVDVALVNQGGIRVNELNAGNITVGKIYEIMPFDNIALLFNLTGAEVQQLMDHFAARGGAAVSGVSFSIKGKMADDVRVNNKPLSATANYTVAISDYLANGGDDLKIFKDKTPQNINYLQRDAIADEVIAQTASGKHIKAAEEQRISRDN